MDHALLFWYKEKYICCIWITDINVNLHRIKHKPDLQVCATPLTVYIIDVACDK